MLIKERITKYNEGNEIYVVQESLWKNLNPRKVTIQNIVINKDGSIGYLIYIGLDRYKIYNEEECFKTKKETLAYIEKQKKEKLRW